PAATWFERVWNGRLPSRPGSQTGKRAPSFSGALMGINRYPPPPQDYFRHLPVRGGTEQLGVEVGSWIYQLEGLDPGLRATLHARYGPFITPVRDPICHRVRVLAGDKDHFLPPEEAEPPRFHPLTLDWEQTILRMRSYGFVGWVSIEESDGEIAL